MRFRLFEEKDFAGKDGWCRWEGGEWFKVMGEIDYGKGQKGKIIELHI